MQTARRHLFLRSIILLGVVIGLAADQPKVKQKKAPKSKAAPRELDPFDRPEGSINDQTARYYVWYDKSGWHLRTTAKGARRFHGTIRVTEGRIAACVPVGLKEGKQKGRPDVWRVNDARSELQFQLTTAQLSDGFDLSIEGEKGEIEFDLNIDMQRNPRSIFVGKARQHPDKNPFSLPLTPTRGGEKGPGADGS
jgi:hypothetical protein